LLRRQLLPLLRRGNPSAPAQLEAALIDFLNQLKLHPNTVLYRAALPQQSDITLRARYSWATATLHYMCA
jgi:hypothetical protein